jgi:NAD(P)-dependent dehydrogenase (short-subunit alcohol dehydrogenase family)
MSAAIVTGTAGGMGGAIATALAVAGHDVVGVDRIDEAPDCCVARVCGDVLSSEIQAEAFDLALRDGGEVFLVNNAGVTLPGYPQADEAWQRTIDINLTAPFQWSRRYASLVEAGKITSGGIVFVGSLATLMGFPKNPAYQASKSGALGLARSFAYDLGPRGIRSNCVSPGYIATAMTRVSYDDPTMNADRKSRTLLGRWGRPEDVAEAVAFLCSRGAGYITGTNLIVDGGWACKGLTESNE